jgi:hypothetical protein
MRFSGRDRMDGTLWISNPVRALAAVVQHPSQHLRLTDDPGQLPALFDVFADHREAPASGAFEDNIYYTKWRPESSRRHDHREPGAR